VHALRPALFAFVLTATAALAGCRVAAPYPPGKPPPVADLMAATAPALHSVQVPRAKVRRGGGPAANLMIVAESPARFSGTIQVSGNELVTLAVNELGYGLRWIGGRNDGDSLPPGYYSGPPSRCAVETLLGVDLEPEAFVGLVLGGAPLIDGPHQILERRWDRKAKRELLTIANDRYQQELSFAWIDDHWQFAGATLWTAGPQQVWLWTISHEELHTVGGEVLPAKTQIRRPKPTGRGELVINITFAKQIPNPRLGGELSADPPFDDEHTPVNAGDTWDDWDDDEGWETDDDDDDAPRPEPRPAPVERPAPKPAAIPPQFVGNPTGLQARGDLCAGRR
jgi:hypothetical protein